MKNNKSIVIQWGNAISGRENIGVELFLGVTQYYDGLVKADKLGSSQVVLLEGGNLGKLSGMMILTGSEDQIQSVLLSEKHRENVVKATSVVANVTVNTGATGEAVGERMQNLVKWRKELGL
jgi:hypothetical protein